MSELAPHLLAIASGLLVGISLGAVGGGGSILAVPLMVYVVGVRQPHVAIGTSAFAVAVNAAWNLLAHARSHNVNWRCGVIFSSAGVCCALIGSTVGKLIDGQKLLFLFAMVMIAVGIMMLKTRRTPGIVGARCNRENIHKVLSFGGGTGLLSGFFGIGGGFLIVPSLIAATGMPIFNAVGTSLVAVTIFGLATSVNYMLSGYLDLPLGIAFIAGGFAGGIGGTYLARRLSARGHLTTLFSFMIFAVALYMAWKSAQALA